MVDLIRWFILISLTVCAHIRTIYFNGRTLPLTMQDEQYSSTSIDFLVTVGVLKFIESFWMQEENITKKWPQ